MDELYMPTLLDDIPELNPDIEIVIVGGGNVYDKLEAQVNEINKKLESIEKRFREIYSGGNLYGNY